MVHCYTLVSQLKKSFQLLNMSLFSVVCIMSFFLLSLILFLCANFTIGVEEVAKRFLQTKVHIMYFLYNNI